MIPRYLLSAIIFTFVVTGLFFPGFAQAQRLKDMVEIQGVRSNHLVGYGIVIGLNGTGDRTGGVKVSSASLRDYIAKLGPSKDSLSSLKPKNIASVMITAELPPFATKDSVIDVNIASIADAKSLQGGTLLASPLYAGDGQVYAVAQGEVVVGGYTASSRGRSETKNHPTAGSVIGGAVVERSAPSAFSRHRPTLNLSLRNPDFSTSTEVENAVNAVAEVYQNLKGVKAEALDSANILLTIPPTTTATKVIAAIEDLDIAPHHRAVIVISEKTGTIVMGKEVRISTVAITHGSLKVRIEPLTKISQPSPLTKTGTTIATPADKVTVDEEKKSVVILPNQVSLGDLVQSLNALGASTSDLISILRAIKQSGALNAELKVI